MIKRIQTLVVLVCFGCNLGLPSVSFAQSAPRTFLDLPAVGTLLSTSPAFAPAMVKGMQIDPKNPLSFNFIVDTGDAHLQGEELKAESTKMIKYFLAAMTVPEKELWVNLSPYEKDRIIANGLGQTEMGRDMLAQDYVLKQLTASLIYPESDLGKTFWAKVYKQAQEKYGTTNIPVNTFNKVWIVPDHATIYEHNGTAFVVENKLKVMLEEDYLAFEKGLSPPKFSVGGPGHKASSSGFPTKTFGNDSEKDVNALGSQIVREMILPELEKEVNQGKNFAVLRQVANAVVLAVWYKQALKGSILGQIYADKNKIKGVDLKDKDTKVKIYNQYLQAFKKGAYNYIKEDFDPLTRKIVPRKYFSGGEVFNFDKVMTVVHELGATDRAQLSQGNDVLVKWAAVGQGPADAAMVTEVVSPEEQAFYRQIPADQMPSAINLVPHGLKLDQFWFAEVDPAGGKLVTPSGSINPFNNLATSAGIKVAVLQALAGAGYTGILEQLLGRTSTKLGDEIDASAVKVGRESLEALAKELDIVIIVGGNEGGFRDFSKDMPVGLVIDPNGKNGRWMYFGDSVEVTNGVKLKIGAPGSSTMVTLVPEGMMPSTDGYRISMAIDKFNPHKPFPRIDPVITDTNTLRKVLGQLAEYMGRDDVDVFIKEMAAEYKFVTLDRPRHDQLKAQAEALGFEVKDRKDGDPLLFIRAMLGIKDKKGKKLFAISVGGANEHIMSVIFSKLYGKAFMASTYAATRTLEQVDKDIRADATRAGQGSLEGARAYNPRDLENYKIIDESLDHARQLGFNVPKGPVTKEELEAHLLTPDSKELKALDNEKMPSSLVISSITGANELDWGVLQPYIQPVTWLENPDGTGTAIISGFSINNDGKVYFFRVGLKSDDVVRSRYSIVARNDLLANPLITQYESTRRPYMAMLERGDADPRAIGEHVENIQTLLKNEEGARGVLERLNGAFAAEKGNIAVEPEVIAAVREVERYMLGDPRVQMADGTVHSVVRHADAAMAAKQAAPDRAMVIPPLQELIGEEPAKAMMLSSGEKGWIQRKIISTRISIGWIKEGEKSKWYELTNNIGSDGRVFIYGPIVIIYSPSRVTDRRGRAIEGEMYFNFLEEEGLISLGDRHLTADGVIQGTKIDGITQLTREGISNLLENGIMEGHGINVDIKGPLFVIKNPRAPKIKEVVVNLAALMLHLLPEPSTTRIATDQAMTVAGKETVTAFLNKERTYFAVTTTGPSVNSFGSGTDLRRPHQIQTVVSFDPEKEETTIKIFRDGQQEKAETLPGRDKLDKAIAEFRSAHPDVPIDSAQVSESVDRAVVVNKDRYGGINLDPAMLNLQIKHDGNGIPLPIDQQPIGNMKIDGFMPVIIKVTPINNLPLLLGIVDKEPSLALSH